MFSFCSRKKFFGLVKMTFGLVDVSYSLPLGQAVKLTFFAPWFSTIPALKMTVVSFLTCTKFLVFLTNMDKTMRNTHMKGSMH